MCYNAGVVKNLDKISWYLIGQHLAVSNNETYFFFFQTLKYKEMVDI